MANDSKPEVQSPEIKLQVGATLQLQFADDERKERRYVRLIGYLPAQSIIVTTPRAEGKVMLIREGQLFTVRLLAGNAVYAFTATVMRVHTRPYPYLHLSYPKKIESIVLRKAHRVATKLIVVVENENPDKAAGKAKSAVIRDISTAGAQLTASESLGELGETISIAVRVEVGGVEQYLTLPAIIRRKFIEKPEEKPNEETYGVEFQFVEDNDRLILHGFVYERLIGSI
jgi:c-di-GMP-binding flagellar brake protein YcgR